MRNPLKNPKSPQFREPEPGTDEYISPHTGQLRRRAWKKFVWDRQGTHGLLGLGLGLGWTLVLFGVPLGMLVAIQGYALVRFGLYEVAEGWRIKDQAYVDLGGEMIGWLLGTAAALGIIATLHLWG